MYHHYNNYIDTISLIFSLKEDITCICKIDYAENKKVKQDGCLTH